MINAEIRTNDFTKILYQKVGSIAVFTDGNSKAPITKYFQKNHLDF